MFQHSQAMMVIKEGGSKVDAAQAVDPMAAVVVVVAAAATAAAVVVLAAIERPVRRG